MGPIQIFMRMEAVLTNSFYDLKSASCYGSSYQLYKNAKLAYPQLKLSDVKKWLSSQYAATMHKNVIRNFSHNKTLTKGMGDQYQIDLVDMQKYERYNDGFKYILTCIDIFSKKAWAVPIKSKRSRDCAEAFKIILDDGVPKRVQSDRGKEFEGSVFQNLLKLHQIRFFSSTNQDIKCAIVERFNRTLKTRLWRYFTHNISYRYVDALPQIINAYNHSFHRSINCRPVDVNKENEADVWIKLYSQEPKMKPFRYRIGDSVRLAKKMGTFAKGHVPQWTEEIFKVSETLRKQIPVYRVQDYGDQPIYGFFYENELQKVTVNDKTYTVEAVLKKRKRNNKTEVLVKWLGYDDSFNQWIPAEDVKDVTHR